MHDRPRARWEDVVSERIDDELVVYDQRTQTAHCLTAVVAAVWERCDGCLSPQEIAQQLRLAPDDVTSAIEALRECQLLDDRPTAAPSYSRREVTARLAKVGGAAFAAPLIYSAAVGSVAAAASHLAAGCPVPTCTASCSTLGSTAPNSSCASGFCYCSKVDRSGTPTANTSRCATAATCNGDTSSCNGGTAGSCCGGRCVAGGCVPSVNTC